MKILQIINSLGTGGAEKLLLDTIPLYRAAGIEMDILLLWDNGQPFTKALQEHPSINVFILNRTEDTKSIYKLANIWNARKYLKNYELVHVHLFPALYFVPLAKLLSGSKAKLLFTEHNTSNRRMEMPFFKLIDRFFYNRYKKIVCITEEIRTKFKSFYGFQDEHFALIENGVNIQKIRDAAVLKREELFPNCAEDTKIILQVSAFRPQKDQKTLIRAMALLPENYRLLLVGDGECKSDCEALSKKLNLENRVRFLGQRMDVPSLVRTADINVLSSHFEGLSLASIEAMASGKPFVASRVPGLEDLVDGHGVLFELGNETQLAQKIQELVDNPTYNQKVVATCQALAAKYDIQKMVDKHISLYKSLLNTDKL